MPSFFSLDASVAAGSNTVSLFRRAGNELRFDKLVTTTSARRLLVTLKTDPEIFMSGGVLG